MKKKLLNLPFKFFLLVTLGVSVLLFLYSFTQVDLSLTLSSASFLQTIQKGFQYVGWFDRPLSAGIYIVILAMLFAWYYFILRVVAHNKLHRRELWQLIFVLAGVLLFAYNAFSYDIFNYIFDAKIMTYYQQNPYLQKALDYPGDPMLSFMRWTHRTYPYGPAWLGITAPLSFIGNNVFVVTFFLFKALMVGCYLLTAYFIGKILQKVSPDHELWGVAFFAFNPLVIIESLVSGHNDIVMMVFAVAAFYFLLQRKYVWSSVFLIISIGIKFATIFLAPIFISLLLSQKARKKRKMEQVFLISILSLFAGVMAATLRTNFQPWYLLMVLPFAALLSYRFYIFVPSLLLSLVALLNYVPFLYLGNWDPPIPLIMKFLNYSAVLGIIVIVAFLFVKHRQLLTRTTDVPK